MSKKIIEQMGMEAKHVVGDKVPCTFVLASEQFGNWSLMNLLAKKMKGEFKVHEGSMYLQITQGIGKKGQEFTSGLTSLEYNGIKIGICSALFGYQLKPTTVMAIPMAHKMQYLKLTKKLSEVANKFPRLKKNSAWAVGSQGNSVIPLKINIEDVISEQNTEILQAIESFFNDPSPYLEVGLPPFRKICFAGAPGTGKTMTANAVAKFLLDKYGIQTIYIGGSTQWGCDFSFIKISVDAAMKMKKPMLLIVEEFDSYCVNEGTRSQVLNFLDGFETPQLKQPLCLLVTTNHPEKIDTAIINRSGRINRIFWFKGIKTAKESNGIVELYRGKLKLPDIGDMLIGKTPDFVKELIVELKWRKANGEPMDRPYISTVIEALGGGTNKGDAQDYHV